MRVAFRVDSSLHMGSGHLMRCLVLANALKDRGFGTAFVSRNLAGNLSSLASSKGHEVYTLPAPEAPPLTSHENCFKQLKLNWSRDAEQCAAALANGAPWNWLVIDHYAIDAEWETALRNCVRRILIIDDLADRRHDCDMLVDQNFYEEAEKRYEALVPADCDLLLGPRFSLLSDEILQARKRRRKRDGNIQRLLVFYGGMDVRNETALALEGAIGAITGPMQIDVVVGRANPNISAIETLCKRSPNVLLHVQTDQMATLMEDADLCLGAGGVAAWERCAVGLPSIVTVVANNQLRSMQDLSARGAIWLAGISEQTTSIAYSQSIEFAMRNPVALRELSEKASAIMNGCEAGLDHCISRMSTHSNDD